MKESEPMRTKGKRYIEMTTAEWIGRLLMPVNTFPDKLKEGCGEILKLRQEKEIKSAVEWLKAEIRKKSHKPNKLWFLDKIDEAFEDVTDTSGNNPK